MPYASDYKTEYVGKGEIEIAFSILITFLWKQRSFLII